MSTNSNRPINELMGITMEKIKEMVDINSIIGDPITLDDGTTIIPISKVSYGFASGGSDLPNKSEKSLFGGGAGAGVSIKPEGFLVISNGNAKMVPVSGASDPVSSAINAIPDVFTKVSTMIKKKKGTGTEEDIPEIEEE
ncbi:MAG: GerW family sporulation protein [Ruminococcus sp.]|nr:sporulation protein YtfJ [Ruminococcus sp.]MBO5382667.1 GerW family sporulation protein [Ruminococcus sp.]